MRFKFILLAVLLLSVMQVFAQQTKTVTGKVTDARTGEVLPGVTIKAGNSNILHKQLQTVVFQLMFLLPHPH